ncbi:PREDICTED: transmembrane protein 117-like [Priapulus caudatus]|uniref:Transmembrane protein 117-like n=1 Tax=Priapulus caudatus TaxID=37621 RepID=A0ABM1DY61_PRICU|nr:PREDICTED: transmembrane protein 117-like [Priapulus caudatus]
MSSTGRLLRLSMFTHDNGSWIVMGLVSIVFVCIFAQIYNGFLAYGHADSAPYIITAAMNVRYETFMKMAASATWLGDFVTAWMVTDMMLQDKLYPSWGRSARAFWQHNHNRIILFWMVWILMTAVVLMVIITNWVDWDYLNHGFAPTCELTRAFLASSILVMDLLILIQDWDFPHFESSNLDIKLPGLNVASIKFRVPACVRNKFWTVHISGKWFNYGVIILVMCLDLNMWINQVIYAPRKYGQYTGPQHEIYTATDEVQYHIIQLQTRYFCS